MLLGERLRGIHGDEERRRRLAYEKWANDSEAAASLGLDRNTFGAWRRSRGLRSKRRAPPVGNSPSIEDVISAFEKTENDLQAAILLGITESTFSGRRAALGLIPKNARKMHPEIREWYFWSYREHTSDPTAAEALGITEASFAQWRRREGLPARAGGPPPREKRGLYLNPQEATCCEQRMLAVVDDSGPVWRCRICRETKPRTLGGSARSRKLPKFLKQRR